MSQRSQTIIVERRTPETGGDIGVIRINRPSTRNALDSETVAALRVAVESFADDDTVRCVVLTGVGGSFCSGADLKSGFMPGSTDMGETMNLALRDNYHPTIRALREMPKPVLAAIDGPAAGYGCDIALACDMRICTVRASFIELFARVNLIPDGGGTFMLPRMIGRGRAFEMVYLTERVSAAKALEFGIVNWVVESDAFDAEVYRIADRLAAGPPLAFAEAKRLINGAQTSTLNDALEAERAAQVRLAESGDFAEGVLAFVEKRTAKFRGA